MNQILGGIMATQQIEDPVKRKIAEYAREYLDHGRGNLFFQVPE